MSEPTLHQCRLCLENTAFLYSLFDEDVVDIIESFTPIKFDEDDDLPSICCSKCLEDVYLVFKIRSRIIESDKKLREKKKTKQQESVCVDIKIEELDDLGNISSSSDTPEIIPIKDESETIQQEVDSDPEHIEITVNPENSPSYSQETEEIEGKFECSECKIAFENHNSFVEHMRRHTILTMCGICGSQVLSCNYKKHMLVHKSTPAVCELCGAVAKNSESLRGHMFYMHKSTAQQYCCKQCGKFFRYKYKYKLHILKQHEGTKSHICEVCAKTFFTATDVKRHIKMTHMKLRPYICQYCNKAFSSSYARRTHVRQHTNEKPFKCEICAEGFRQRVSLKTHLKSKHGIVQIVTEQAASSEAEKEPLAIELVICNE